MFAKKGIYYYRQIVNMHISVQDIPSLFVLNS